LLVYELQQAREFARIEYLATNRSAFLEIERQMSDPDVAAIWAKSVVKPETLTYSEIRVMDAYLIGIYNYWQQLWVLSKDGLFDAAELEKDLVVDAPYYFGSDFARIWWDDLKSIHVKEDVRKFDALIDKALANADPSDNRKYLERISRQIQGRAAEKPD